MSHINVYAKGRTTPVLGAAVMTKSSNLSLNHNTPARVTITSIVLENNGLPLAQHAPIEYHD